MALCKFFQQGSCRFGNNCRFEHPRAGDNRDQPSNRFGALGQGGRAPGGPQDLLEKYGISTEMIERDLTSERPQWILSAYGPGRAPPDQLFGGYPREQSCEEMRLHYITNKASGNEQQALAQAQELYQTAEQQIQTALQNAKQAATYIVEGEDRHPNRLEICAKATQGAPFGEFLVGKRPRSMVPDTSQASPFSNNTPAPLGGAGASTSAFGQPSNLGQRASPFGNPQPQQSTFGQASTPGPSASPFGGQPQPSAFGQPAPTTSAFGQPSALGAKPNPFGAPSFGQPSQPGAQGNAFGQPPQQAAQGNAFGQASQPAAQGNAFGQPPQQASQGNAFGQAQPAAQGNAFGQPSQLGAQGNAFGQASQLGQKPSPFAASSNTTSSPFANANNTNNTPAPNPFGSGASNTVASPSPFGAASGNNNTAGPNPFGQPAQNASPFAQAAQAAQPAAAPATPFGAASQPTPEASNPFAQTQPAQQQGSNAFGQPSGGNNAFAQKNASPFGQPAAAASPAPANPFGAPQTQPAQTQQAQTKPAGVPGNPYPPGSTRQHPPVEQYMVKRDNQLVRFKGKPVQYKDDRPGVMGSDGAWSRIWFPNGPPSYYKDTELRPEQYDEKTKAQWTAFAQTGQFQDGLMPALPPPRQLTQWDF